MLTTYLVALVALGFLAASGRAPERLVVPVLVVAFVAPLLLSPALVRRALRGDRQVRNGGAAPGRRAGAVTSGAKCFPVS